MGHLSRIVTKNISAVFDNRLDSGVMTTQKRRSILSHIYMPCLCSIRYTNRREIFLARLA